MARSFGLLLVAVLLLLQSGCVGIRPPAGSTMIRRTILTTGYCKCQKCCSWKRKGGRAVDFSGRPKKVGITASGTRARHGTIAADTRKYPFGTVMYVPEYGYGRVEDRGGAIKGERIDLFFPSHGAALKWGKLTKNVKIWLPPGLSRGY